MTEGLVLGEGAPVGRGEEEPGLVPDDGTAEGELEAGLVRVPLSRRPLVEVGRAGALGMDLKLG